MASEFLLILFCMCFHNAISPPLLSLLHKALGSANAEGAKKYSQKVLRPSSRREGSKKTETYLTQSRVHA